MKAALFAWHSACTCASLVRRAAILGSLAWALGACEPMPCFGDSCNCYGDPEAPNANAGCADCTPARTCEKLFDRVRECGLEIEGSSADCEDHIRDGSCHESIETTDCAMLDVACANREASCYAELVANGLTTCSHGLVDAEGGGTTVEPCPSGSCYFGECVECVPFVLECGPGFACDAGDCRPVCSADLDCGPEGHCFAGVCDPPLGTPCSSQLECGTRWCRAQGGGGSICTEPCLACSQGQHCGCPSGFACVDAFCAPI
jgi:hypothetical protein